MKQIVSNLLSQVENGTSLQRILLARVIYYISQEEPDKQTLKESWDDLIKEFRVVSPPTLRQKKKVRKPKTSSSIPPIPSSMPPMLNDSSQELISDR